MREYPLSYVRFSRFGFEGSLRDARYARFESGFLYEAALLRPFRRSAKGVFP